MTKEELLAKALVVSFQLRNTGDRLDAVVGELLDEIAGLLFEETECNEEEVRIEVAALSSQSTMLENGNYFMNPSQILK